MARWFDIVADPIAERDLVRARRYGVIETSGGEFTRLVLRPWPKLLSPRELWPLGDEHHERGPADRCRLYYNQPRSCPNFLALKYVATTHGASYRTFLAALRVLDQVAEIKRTDALVCDAANSRLTDRFMARMGWEPHAPMPWRRNFIKRFYGQYPVASDRQAPPRTPPQPTLTTTIDTTDQSGAAAHEFASPVP